MRADGKVPLSKVPFWYNVQFYSLELLLYFSKQLIQNWRKSVEEIGSNQLVIASKITNTIKITFYLFNRDTASGDNS